MLAMGFLLVGKAWVEAIFVDGMPMEGIAVDEPLVGAILVTGLLSEGMVVDGCCYTRSFRGRKVGSSADEIWRFGANYVQRW